MREILCILLLVMLAGVILAKDDQKESDFAALKAKLIRDVKQLLTEKKLNGGSSVAKPKNAGDETKRAELYIQNAMVEVNPGDICYRKTSNYLPGYSSNDWSSPATFSSPDWSSSSWYYSSLDWSSSSWYHPSSDWSSSSWYYSSPDWSSSSWHHPSSDWYSSSWYYSSPDWSSSSWHHPSSVWASSSWYNSGQDWSSGSWYYPSSDWLSDSSTWDSYSSHGSYSMYDSSHGPYMYPVDPNLFTGESCGYNYWYNDEYRHCVWEEGCGLNIWNGYKRGFKRATAEQRDQRLRMLRELSSNQKRMPVAKSESPRKQEVEKQNKPEVAQYNNQDAINKMLHKKFEAFKHLQERNEMAGKSHKAETLNGKDKLRGHVVDEGVERAKIQNYLRGLMARERMGKNREREEKARMEGHKAKPNKA